MASASNHNVSSHHNQPGASSTGGAAGRPPLMSSISQTGDIALWLHNKLGTSNDLWSDNSSIISQLNSDVLRQIKDVFGELQVNVKLKLLLSFLHISRRNLEDWKNELEPILEIAMVDADPWVSVVGEMLRNFPRKGTINFDFHANTGNATFLDLVNEIKKLVKLHGDRGILPLECLYLNRPVFQACYGALPQLPKHFTLRRKAKSATLRAELLQKAADASSGRRPSTGPAVPIRCRGLNSDSTPLKGIPSRNSFSGGYNSGYGSSGYGAKAALSRLGSLGSSTSTPTGGGPLNRLSRFASLGGSGSMGSGGAGKRDGGIVLLDIAEAPSTQRDAKRRKTTTSISESDKNSKAGGAKGGPDAAASGAGGDGAPSSQGGLPSGTTPNTPTIGGATSPSRSNQATTTSPSTPVLGHKSVSSGLGSLEGHELPGIKKANPQAVDPYDLSHELAQQSAAAAQEMSSRAGSSMSIASKSTPDYAAGLLGSSVANSPHPVSRYGHQPDHHHHQPTIGTKSSGGGGMSLLSSNAAGPGQVGQSTSSSSTANTAPSTGMYAKAQEASMLQQQQPQQQQQSHQKSVASLGGGGGDATNGSSYLSNPVSSSASSLSPSPSSNLSSSSSPVQGYFKPAVMQPVQPSQAQSILGQQQQQNQGQVTQANQQQSQQQQPQQAQVPSSYRNYVNQFNNQTQKIQQQQQVPQPQVHQTPTVMPTNTMYGVVRPQQGLLSQQQQQQQQQGQVTPNQQAQQVQQQAQQRLQTPQQPQQRLMYNPVVAQQQQNAMSMAQQQQQQAQQNTVQGQSGRPGLVQTQSVIHANPQQQAQQAMQQQRQMQFGMTQQQAQQAQQQATAQQAQQAQQQQRSFGMYGQQSMGQQAQQAQQQQQAQQTQSPQQRQVQQAQQVTTPPQQSAQQQTPPAPTQQQRMFIAREVTQQASAIFNASNCLTRPEKALILGFMTGTQANPVPHMGSVSMIKYLEKLEEHHTASGAIKALVEEHFQMNFATGEWKTVRSIRAVDPNHTVGGSDQGNQTRIVVLDPTQQHHFVTTSAGRAQQTLLSQQVGNTQQNPGAGGVGLGPGQAGMVGQQQQGQMGQPGPPGQQGRPVGGAPPGYMRA